MTDPSTLARDALRECQRILNNVRTAYEDDTPLAEDIDGALGHLKTALDAETVLDRRDADLDNRIADLARQTAISVDLYARCDDLKAGLSLALSVALDCESRWSRGHPERVQKAAAALARAQAGEPVPHVIHYGRAHEALQRAEVTDARMIMLRASLQSLLDTQPPPVCGDYDDDVEDAAIDARDATRDWYRLQLKQVLEGLKG